MIQIVDEFQLFVEVEKLKVNFDFVKCKRKVEDMLVEIEDDLKWGGVLEMVGIEVFKVDGFEEVVIEVCGQIVEFFI